MFNWKSCRQNLICYRWNKHFFVFIVVWRFHNEKLVSRQSLHGASLRWHQIKKVWNVNGATDNHYGRLIWLINMQYLQIAFCFFSQSAMHLQFFASEWKSFRICINSSLCCFIYLLRIVICQFAFDSHWERLQWKRWTECVCVWICELLAYIYLTIFSHWFCTTKHFFYYFWQ